MSKNKAIKDKIGFIFLKHFVFTRSLLYLALLTTYVGLASVILFTFRSYWVLLLDPIIVFLCVYYTDKILTPILKLKPYYGKYRKELFSLAQKYDVTLKQIYEKKSTAMNGVAMGLWNNNSIMLFSHLLDAYPYDEIEAIMAHEVGHLKEGATVQVVGASLLGIVCSVINVALVHSYFHNQWLYLLLLSFIEVFFFLPIGLIYRRRYEHNADLFALQSIKDKKAFARAFQRNTKEWKAKGVIISDTPSFFDKMYFDHPLTADRIKLASS